MIGPNLSSFLPAEKKAFIKSGLGMTAIAIFVTMPNTTKVARIHAPAVMSGAYMPKSAM